jgi:hypothetical protein
VIIFITKFVLKIFEYDNDSNKERLYDYIRVADDKKVEAIYALLEDQIVTAIDWSEDEDFVAELDERVRRHEAGIDRAQTWDELEASIEELKRKRSAK